MKKIILFSLMSFPLYGAEIISEYIPKNTVLKLEGPQEIISFDPKLCPYMGTQQRRCKDIVWLKNGIILAHCYMVNQNPNKILEEGILLEEAIVSIDTNNNYTSEILSHLKSTASDDVYITANENRNVAVISLPHTTLIYQNPKDIQEQQKLKSVSRPAIISPTKIIFFNDTGCNIYNEQNIVPYTDLNNEIEKALSSLTEATQTPNESRERFCTQSDFSKVLVSHHLKNQKNNLKITSNGGIHIYFAEIAKIPTTNDFYLTLLWAMFKWNAQAKTLQRISLPDSTISPIEMPITAYDIQCHPKEMYVSLTYDAAYNGWILNKEEQLSVLQKEQNNETEQYRRQYIENPTHQNGSLLIRAAWKNTDKMDAKAFHPSLLVIATLSKGKGLLKYWDPKTSKVIITQNLPPSGREPHDCLYSRVTFSPNGQQIACGLDSALVILDVPKKVLNFKSKPT